MHNNDGKERLRGWDIICDIILAVFSVGRIVLYRKFYVALKKLEKDQFKPLLKQFGGLLAATILVEFARDIG